MHGFNKNGLKLLELHPRWCKRSYVQVQLCKKFNKILSYVHKTEDAHLQCVNNHYAKFEYKGMKTVGVTVYTNPKHFEWEKCLSSTPLKN